MHLLSRAARLASFLVALGLAACASHRPALPPTLAAVAPQEPLAFLWEVTRPEAPDRPLFITGTIHVGLSAHPLVFPPSLNAALQRSQALVLELDPDEEDREQAQKDLLKLGLYTPPDHLTAHLSKETIEVLSAELPTYGMTLAQAERIRPWFLAATLETIALKKAGADPDQGLEWRLIRTAGKSKRIIGLETGGEQLRVLTGFSEKLQDRMLRASAKKAARAPMMLAKAASAWEEGSAESMAGPSCADAADNTDHHEVCEALVYSRNRAMSEKIAAMVGGDETRLVAIGAGHLPGEKGVLALLAKKGLRVRQLPRQ